MFFENDGALVNLIIELAIDPTNSFNQPYLLAVLLAICKQLKPQSGANNLFKDLDEENEDSDSTKVSASIQASNFDADSQASKNLVSFLKNSQNNQLIYNLLIIINSQDTREGFTPKYTNQQNLEITKIG